jgi:preprotein translocase subunit SecG
VIYLLYVIHVLVCLFLILVVLLQQGKGADLSVFGGGSTQTAFGARSATTLLHKLTVASFIIFILTTVSIAILKSGPSGGTVMAGANKGKAAPTAPAKPGPAPKTPAAP